MVQPGGIRLETARRIGSDTEVSVICPDNCVCKLHPRLALPDLVWDGKILSETTNRCSATLAGQICFGEAKLLY